MGSVFRLFARRGGGEKCRNAYGRSVSGTPGPGPAEALGADQHLKDQGIIVRHPRSYKLPDCLRITVGRPEDNSRVLAALTTFKETA